MIEFEECWSCSYYLETNEIGITKCKACENNKKLIEEYNNLHKIIKYLNDKDEDFWIIAEDDGIHVIINMNEIFYWATSDGEEFFVDDIDLFEKAYQDCINAGVEDYHAALLWAARKRNIKPQDRVIKRREEKSPGLSKLFEGLPSTISCHGRGFTEEKKDV